MSQAGLGSRLASLSRAAEVFTTHDRPQDSPHDSPQESATGQPVGAPLETRAQHDATSVAFSLDGKLLASGGIDGTVRL